ncbi:MAG: pyruvate kinase [Microgenomates group bacterium]
MLSENLKSTKIIATLGPACDSESKIKKMILAGVDVFRFNFKHADIEWHEERIKRVNRVAKKLGYSIGILLDLQGPEIRVKLPYEELVVEKGKLYPFGDIIFEKNEIGISITYSQLINKLQGGEKVLIEDGYYEFEVVKKGNQFYLKSKQDGIIKNKKNFNISNVSLPFKSLTNRDLEGIKTAAQNEVDFIALSFVRKPEDILLLKKEMKKHNLNAKIIAKIETAEAVKNIDKIILESDGVMVARGDLAVELPMEQVPYYQKLIINKARANNKFVITATQMLQTMTTSRLPTRAEISDVANACYDKSDALMLSAESASGQYPIEAVETMKKIILFNEKKFDYDSNLTIFHSEGKEEIFAKTVVEYIKKQTELDSKIELIIVFTETGRTARRISTYRPFIPIIAVVPNKKIARSLTINYGVYPLVYSEGKGREITLDSIKKAIFYFKKKINGNFQDAIILHGDYWRVKGKITTLRFYSEVK